VLPLLTQISPLLGEHDKDTNKATSAESIVGKMEAAVGGNKVYSSPKKQQDLIAIFI
jgi:hypothetical protein